MPHIKTHQGFPDSSVGKESACNAGGGLVAKSCLTLAAPWTIAFQVPLSMGFSRQDTRVGCHALFQGNLPNPGIEP